MLISSTEVLERLDNPDNIIRRRENDKLVRQLSRVRLPEHQEDLCAIAPVHNGGRRPGDNNLTPESRADIGAAARVLSIAEVAEASGVSPHHAHELAHGKHSNAQGTNPELVDAINEKLETPHELALKKLTETLLGINPALEKSPTKLASMASQLARVAEHTAPIKHADPLDAAKDCRLVVYAPTIKQENHYESVQVERPVQVAD